MALARKASVPIGSVQDVRRLCVYVCRCRLGGSVFSPRNESRLMNLPSLGSQKRAAAKKRLVSLSQMFSVKEEWFLEELRASGNRKLPQVCSETVESPFPYLSHLPSGTSWRQRRRSGGARFRFRRTPCSWQGKAILPRAKTQVGPFSAWASGR